MHSFLTRVSIIWVQKKKERNHQDRYRRKKAPQNRNKKNFSSISVAPFFNSIQLKNKKIQSSHDRSSQLRLGPFTLSDIEGKIETGEMKTLSIECCPETEGHLEEKIVIIVDNCLPKNKLGKSLILKVDSHVPSIDFDELDAIFPESYIVDDIQDFQCPNEVNFSIQIPNFRNLNLIIFFSTFFFFLSSLAGRYLHNFFTHRKMPVLRESKYPQALYDEHKIAQSRPRACPSNSLPSTWCYDSEKRRTRYICTRHCSGNDRTDELTNIFHFFYSQSDRGTE